MYDWVYKKMRAKHFTLAKWRKMKVGDVIDVAIFDRNFEEYFIWDKTKAGKIYKPSYFFRMNHHTIKKNGPMTYNINFRWLKPDYNPKKFDPKEDGRMIEVSTKEIHEKWEWCPVTREGRVECRPDILFDEIPGNIRLGWHGPIILWSDVKKAPDVYRKKVLED